METKGEQAKRIVDHADDILNASLTGVALADNPVRLALYDDVAWLVREAPGNPAVYKAMTGGFGLPTFIPSVLRDTRFGTVVTTSGVFLAPRQLILQTLPKVAQDELYWWGGPALVYVILGMLNTDPDFEVRVAAMRALDKLPWPAVAYPEVAGMLGNFRKYILTAPVSAQRRTDATQVADKIESRYEAQGASAAAAAAGWTSPGVPQNAADLAALTQLSTPTLPPLGADWRPWAFFGVVLGAIGGYWWRKTSPRPVTQLPR